MNDFEVFISHSSKDRDIVERIRDYLERNQILCFDSERDIPAGESYPGVITRSIRTAKVVLLIYTDNSNASEQVDRELEQAMKSKKKMFVLKFSDQPYSDDKEYILSIVEYLDMKKINKETLFLLYQKMCSLLGKEVANNLSEKEQSEKEQLANVLVDASKGDGYALFFLGKIYYYGWFDVQQNYNDAFVWFKRAFDKGYDNASDYLSWFYNKGIGVEKNIEKAFIYSKISAIHGNSMSQIDVANYYFSKNTDEDNREGIKWLTIAANNGNSDAMFLLGNHYFLGDVLQQDHQKCIELLQKASGLNNDKAQIVLAGYYLTGVGIDKNIDKCIELLNRAKANGNVKALIELSKIFSNSDYDRLDYDEAFACDNLAAEKNDPEGYLFLFYDYKNGWGTEIDYNKSFDNLQKAVELNSPAAMYNLAELYENGSEQLGITSNDQKAFYYYEKSADLGDLESIKKMYEYYSEGKIVEQNWEVAFSYAMRAATAGDNYYQCLVAKCYQSGRGVEQNDVEAFNWFITASKDGSMSAWEGLGKCYYYGIGTEQDFELAVKCFDTVIQFAGEKGEECQKWFSESFYLLGTCYEQGLTIEKDIAKAMINYTVASVNGEEAATDALQRLAATDNNKGEV